VDAVDDVMQAWIVALQQIASKMAMSRITGKVSVGDFQAVCKAVSEKTTSSSSAMHYSI